MATVQYILERVESKRSDYRQYNFTQTEDNAFKAFFDLSQEFDDIEDFYTLCVIVPMVFFDLNARLYLIEPKYDGIVLVSKTENQGPGLYTPPPDDIKPDDPPYYTANNSLVLTIHGKKLLTDQLPFKISGDVLGLLEVYPIRDMSDHLKLFFEKYANRIGFNLHNRFIMEKNIEHLKFIRTLVADIEHNVIVPNMVYKLFLRGLKGKIMKNAEIENNLLRLTKGEPCDEVTMEGLLAEFKDVNRALLQEFENIEKHYQNMSLFLETLFRRSHFDQGRLTLRTKTCNMKIDVVQPQLERFVERFKDAGISVEDRLSGIPDQEVISVIDVGLIAQVYANLFSNALKYTQEIVTKTGERKKYISYGREVIRDFFGPGRDGIKYNVFNTGQHIRPEEREEIFEEENRGSNAAGKPGTGHGLTFIKNAVEIHGGAVGYEAVRYGNNFYFILPQ